MQVTHDPVAHTICVRLSDAMIPVCAIILHRVKRLFDLQTDPAAINAVLGDLARERAGLRVPGAFDEFELVVRAILGQQISVAGARTLAGRFAVRFGTPISTSEPSLTHLFPTASHIAKAKVEEICKLGITGKRAATLIAVARAMHNGALLLEPGNRVEETLDKLREIPGIGEWTTQYIAMRALSWPDAFPHTDLGIVKALGEKNPRKILALTEKWRPWRAYAALHLWAELEKKL
jgi:AraC family transcriptional regulator of adaptative response / DNA-3-methyladenine glycosylase II